MPDQLSDTLSKLTPDELQQLHTATYQIKFGKVSGSFDSAKVDQLWNGLNAQVTRGPGAKADVEHPLLELGKSAMGLIPQMYDPGLGASMGVAEGGKPPSPGPEVMAEYGRSGALGAAGAIAGVSKSDLEAEAAKGHTSTILAKTAIPTIMALAGLRGALKGGPPGVGVGDPFSLTTETPTPTTFMAREAAKLQTATPKPAEGAIPVATPDVTPKVAPVMAARPVEAAPRPSVTASDVKPVPGPTAQSVIDQINAGTRITHLDEPSLKLVGDMSQADAETAGLSRANWMSVQAKVRRLSEPPAPAATPGEALHKGITAVVKETLPIDRVPVTDTILRRQDDLRDLVTTVAKADHETKVRAVDSLDARADAANRQAAEIRRVQDAADFNAEITKIRHENLAKDLGRYVAGDSVGFDPDTGRPVVMPELDEEGNPVAGGTKPQFVSGITQERRQLLGMLAGEEQGRWRLARDPITGEALPQAKLSAEQKTERDSFVAKMTDQLNQWRADVLAQGGRPTEAQLGEGEKLVAGLQAASGKRFLYSGKKGLNIDEFGVATWEGIDPNQAWWNKAMGRPVTSHFAKPDPVRIQGRLDQLGHEATLSTQISDRLKNSLTVDHDAAKPQTNGSGESAASAEAISRVASEKANGVKRVKVDTRSGVETPIANTTDAVDLRPGKHERIEIVKPDGSRETVAEGAAARPSVRPTGTPIDQAAKIADVANLPKAETPPPAPAKPGLLNEADIRILRQVVAHPNAEPGVKASAVEMLRAHEEATAKPAVSDRTELTEALPRLQRQLEAATGKEEQARLRDTIAAYKERLARPDTTPEQQSQIAELQMERQKLARMQETGNGAGKVWNEATKKYDKPGAQETTAKTIKQLETTLGEAAPAAPPRAAAVIAGTKAIKEAPKVKADLGAAGPAEVKPIEPEAGAEDLMSLFQAKSDEVPGALMKNLEALHDPKSPLPKEGLDFIAQGILNSESASHLPLDEVAQRYFRALAVYKKGLGAKDPMALNMAMRVAKYGKLDVPPGQEGFINAGFLLDMAQELGRFAKNRTTDVKDLLGYARDWMDRGMWMGVPSEVKDVLFRYKGNLAKIEDLGRIAFNGGIQAIRNKPLGEQLELIRRYQAGEHLGDPELNGLADIARQLQGKMWVEMRTVGRPSLAFWEDHLRNFYEKPPNNISATARKYSGVVDSAVLKGDQGMFRQRQYEDLLDGIAAGGVPATTNLFEMHLMDLGRQAQYIEGQHLINNLKDMGRLVKGTQGATGLLKPMAVPDNIQSRFFPTKDLNGNPILGAGEKWYGERYDIEAMNNWLKPDYVRQNVIGKALIGFKNLYTPIELLGPYHAFSVVAKSIALDLGQGVNRAYVGSIHGELGEAMKGFGDALTALKAPYSFFKEGRALQEAGGQTLVAWQKYQYDKQNFVASKMGQRLEKLYPGMDLDKVIDASLAGGARFDVQPDYQLKWRKAVINSWQQHNYIQSAANIPFAAVEAVTSPLFQKYIPALKLGAIAREINVEEYRNADAVANGEMSLDEVHQRAVRRVDNVLGEVNWDNFYLRKWQKTLLQIGYRSPGWRLGTLDLTKNAAWGQMREVYNAGTSNRIPTADPNMLYLASEMALMAGASAVFMNLFAHKPPSSLTDVTAPQTGDKDSRGKPIRVNWPLYGSRDVPEILSSPFKYATGGETGFIQRGREAVANRSFEGVEIGGVGARVLHTLTPNTFAISGRQRMQAQGTPLATTNLNLFGLNPARRDLDMSDAEKLLSERVRRTQITRTVDQEAVLQSKQRIEAAYLSGRYDDMGKYIQDAVVSRQLKPSQIQETIRQAQKPYIERLGRGLKAEDLVDAYRVATPEERPSIMRMLIPKLRGNQKAIEKFTEAQKSEAPREQ